jgi:hypothetical protein
MAFPTEMITMLGSTILGWGMTAWSKSMEMRAAREQLIIAKAEAQSQIYDKVRSSGDKGFHWTRRTIALMAAFFIIAWPKIVVVFWPDIPVVVSWTELTGGFWFFTDAKEVMIWKELGGLVITPLDTHLMMAIIGLFFGNQITKT